MSGNRQNEPLLKLRQNPGTYNTTSGQSPVVSSEPATGRQGLGATQQQVTYQTGEVYIGQWLQVSPTLGYPHGWGVKYGNREHYQGQWREGLKHGQGVRTLQSGERYDGGWKENKREGYGQQTYVDGTTYEGGWHDDAEWGWGKKGKPTGEIYSGGFVNGKEHGYAVRKHLDGRIFEGGIKEGRAAGYGVGMSKDGRRIDCGWKEGKAHGWGIESVGRLSHVGNFADGFWEGPGTQTYDGKVTGGEWKKGKVIQTTIGLAPKAPTAGRTGESQVGDEPEWTGDETAWISERKGHVKHRRLIAVEGHGEVHEVQLHF
jgi:hypothetical protein